MEFKSREELTEWLLELIDGELELGTQGDITASFGAYGRSEVEIYFDNGDTATLTVTMQDKDFNDK